MFCKNCGAEVADNTLFCPKCGEKVNQAPNQGSAFSTQNNQQYGSPQYGYQNGGGYNPPVRNSSNAPGKAMLIVAGILVLIGGLITLVSDLQAMEYLKYFSGTSIGGALVFEIIFAIVMIVAAICSLVYCGRKDKAGMVFTLGMVVVIMRIIDWIMASALFQGIISVVNASSVILGFIAPILIVVGGYMNKKN